MNRILDLWLRLRGWRPVVRYGRPPRGVEVLVRRVDGYVGEAVIGALNLWFSDDEELQATRAYDFTHWKARK